MSRSSAEFDRLYFEHHGWLLGWLKKRMHGEESAADLAHDTFLRLIGKPALRGELQTPRAYLCCIAQGLLINFWRRRDVERAWLAHLAQQAEPAQASEETRFIALEALLHIDRLLQALPERSREVFLLSRLDGLSHAAIAQQLGISLRTVKRDMAAAWLHCLSRME